MQAGPTTNKPSRAALRYLWLIETRVFLRRAFCFRAVFTADESPVSANENAVGRTCRQAHQFADLVIADVARAIVYMLVVRRFAIASRTAFVIIIPSD